LINSVLAWLNDTVSQKTMH